MSELFSKPVVEGTVKTVVLGDIDLSPGYFTEGEGKAYLEKMKAETPAGRIRMGVHVVGVKVFSFIPTKKDDAGNVVNTSDTLLQGLSFTFCSGYWKQSSEGTALDIFTNSYSTTSKVESLRILKSIVSFPKPAVIELELSVKVSGKSVQQANRLTAVFLVD